MSIRKYIGLVVLVGLAGTLAYGQDAVRKGKTPAAPAAAGRETGKSVDGKAARNKLPPLVDGETAFQKAWATRKAPASPAAAGQETGKPVDEKDVRNKLLPLTDMETAFKKAWANRVALTRQVDELEKKLTDSTVAEGQKKEIRRSLGEARKDLQALAVAMEVIFSAGLTRNYEFDEVKSTIYLRVGTAEEVFVRAVKARDLCGKAIAEQKAALAQETDAERKRKLEETIDDLTKRYQLVAAALQQVYGVVPSREFLYNPQNATLYLKVSENEVAKLKEQLVRQQEELKAKDAAASAAVSSPAARKK